MRRFSGLPNNDPSGSGMFGALRNADRGRQVLRRYGALLATFATFFVAAFFSFQVLFDQKRLIEKESKIDIWFLAKTEIEFLRLMDGLQHFVLGDPDIDRDRVGELFEVFWSRLPILL